MKRFFLLLAVMLMPLSVKAMAISESFDVGDDVSVALFSDSDNPGTGFHVLKESKSGERTVTLIYDGTIEGSPTIYDETRPDDGHEATANLNDSVVYQKMMSVIKQDGKEWRFDTASLLSLEDLTNLGITKNANGIYEIPAKYSFLAPIKQDGLPSDHYNYWTSIKDDSAATTSVYCVSYNENRTGDDGVWATLESRSIASITNNSECAIRPVIVIDKAYILCNNSKKTPNAKTGINDYIVPLAALLLVTASAVVLTKKKSVFKEI